MRGLGPIGLRARRHEQLVQTDGGRVVLRDLGRLGLIFERLGLGVGAGLVDAPETVGSAWSPASDFVARLPKGLPAYVVARRFSSGYLTRKLADVAQNVVVTTHDCGTTQGITKGVIYRGEKVEVSLADSIKGRVSRTNIVNPITDEVVVREMS